MAVVAIKPTTQIEKKTKTVVDTILVTPEKVRAWKLPLFQRQLRAMAVALKREMKLDGVIMSVGVAYTVKGESATRYIVPDRTSREVVSFDRGGHFAAGSYRLQAPRESNKLGRHSGGEAPTHSYGEVYKRKTPHVLTSGIRSTLGAKR